jgi:hypothetical protein
MISDERDEGVAEYKNGNKAALGVTAALIR